MQNRERSERMLVLNIHVPYFYQLAPLGNSRVESWHPLAAARGSAQNKLPATRYTSAAGTKTRPSGNELEKELHTQLHATRITNGGHNAISRCRGDVQAHRSEVRMIENVEELPSELQAFRLVKAKTLRQGCVEPRCRWPIYNVAAGIPYTIHPGRWIGEARSVEKLLKPVRRTCIRIADHVGSSARRRTTQ
jgi:hypothetical protein